MDVFPSPLAWGDWFLTTFFLLRRQQSKHLTDLSDQPTTSEFRIPSRSGWNPHLKFCWTGGWWHFRRHWHLLHGDKTAWENHNNRSRQWNRWNMVFHWRKLVMKLEVFMKSLGKNQQFLPSSQKCTQLSPPFLQENPHRTPPPAPWENVASLNSSKVGKSKSGGFFFNHRFGMYKNPLNTCK